MNDRVDIAPARRGGGRPRRARTICRRAPFAPSSDRMRSWAVDPHRRPVARAALGEPVGYVAIGPVFGTHTKSDRLRAARARRGRAVPRSRHPHTACLSSPSEASRSHVRAAVDRRRRAVGGGHLGSARRPAIPASRVRASPRARLAGDRTRMTDRASEPVDPTMPPTQRRSLWMQRPLLAVGVLASVVIGGTVGYMVIEGWSAWDAFYMTVITVTTVGYREIHDLSRAGRGLHRRAAVRGSRRGSLHVYPRRGGGRRGRVAQPTSVAQARTHARNDPRSFHHLRLRPHRQHRGGTAPARAGAVCRRRTRSGPLSVGAGRWPAGRSRRTRAARTCSRRAGIERARGLIAVVGTDAENVYAVLSAHVLQPDSLHRGASRDRGCRPEAEAGRRQSGDFAVSDRRGPDCADGAASGGRRFRRAGDELRESRAGDRGNSRRTPLRRSPISRFSKPICGSASA